MEGLLSHGAYSQQDYDQELEALQDAFMGAIQSTKPMQVAGLRSLQKAFPNAGFALQVGSVEHGKTCIGRHVPARCMLKIFIVLAGRGAHPQAHVQ